MNAGYNCCVCALFVFHRYYNYQFSKWGGGTLDPLKETGEDLCFKKSTWSCTCAFYSKYHSGISTILL